MYFYLFKFINNRMKEKRKFDYNKISFGNKRKNKLINSQLNIGIGKYIVEDTINQNLLLNSNEINNKFEINHNYCKYDINLNNNENINHFNKINKINNKY